MLTTYTHIRLLFSQFDPIQRAHDYLQYIVWPQSLIFIAIDFILPKRWRHSLPIYND